MGELASLFLDIIVRSGIETKTTFYTKPTPCELREDCTSQQTATSHLEGKVQSHMFLLPPLAQEPGHTQKTAVVAGA